MYSSYYHTFPYLAAILLHWRKIFDYQKNKKKYFVSKCLSVPTCFISVKLFLFLRNMLQEFYSEIFVRRCLVEYARIQYIQSLIFLRVSCWKCQLHISRPIFILYKYKIHFIIFSLLQFFSFSSFLLLTFNIFCLFSR